MDPETLFDIFKIAIEKEREAYEFYSNAAANTANPEAKKLFMSLSEIELQHERMLKERYAELKGNLSK